MIFTVAAFLLAAVQSHAENAEIVRSPQDKAKISALTFSTDSPEIFFKSQALLQAPYIKIQGHFSKKDYALFNESEILVNSDDGGKAGGATFETEVLLKGPTNQLTFYTVGPLGDMQKEVLVVKVADWDALADQTKAKPEKSHYLNASLGYTIISYKESDIGQFGITALTFKAAHRWFFAPPHWDLGTNFFVNLFPISTSGTTKTARFLGANLRVGYLPDFVKPPWTLSVMVGFAFNTMLVEDDAFGYANVLNLQLYPVLSRYIDNNYSVFGYLKLVPGSSLTNYALQNGEKAAGFGLVRNLEKGQSVMVTFDFSYIRLPIEGAILQSTSWSLGVGYGINLK